MKKKLDDRGFALMEILVVIMILTSMASVFYGIAGIKYRMAIEKIREDEAYYAAVSAVRMMAGEVAEGNAEWITNDGIKRTDTKLTFYSDYAGGEVVSVPIEVWSERNKDELLLAAEVKHGRKKKKVTLELRLEASEENVSDENNVEKTTASNAALEEHLVWVPRCYRIEE